MLIQCIFQFVVSYQLLQMIFCRDMDFNLDTEFGKIPSFKLDMPDLDFACPPKKSYQSTDKKGEASCAKSGKQDGFDFNFDFNDKWG